MKKTGGIVQRVELQGRKETAFGTVSVPTGKFRYYQKDWAPRHDRLMTAREKEIRKLLKPVSGSAKCTTNPWQRELLRRELHAIVNKHPEPTT